MNDMGNGNGNRFNSICNEMNWGISINIPMKYIEKG